LRLQGDITVRWYYARQFSHDLVAEFKVLLNAENAVYTLKVHLFWIIYSQYNSTTVCIGHGDSSLYNLLNDLTSVKQLKFDSLRFLGNI